MSTPRSIALALTCLAAVAAAGGCGGSSRIGEDLPRRDARLMLDAPLGAVHAGIALAVERGFDRGEGVRLRLRPPGRGGARPALRDGRIEAAIVSLDELIAIRVRGVDAVGVMALVQRPLTSVLAAPPVRSGRDLEDRRVAVGDDGDARAVLRSLVTGDGGDFARVDVVPGGATAVEALESRRVAAATVDRLTEGVAVRKRRPSLRELRPEDDGAPAYPGLVLVVTRETLEEDANVVRALIRGLQRGYREAQIDPESAVTALEARGARDGRAALLAQLDAVSPSWTAGAGAYGRLRPEVLRAWAAWAVSMRLAKRPPRVEEVFATDLVTRQSNP